MSPIYFKEQGWSFLNDLLKNRNAIVLCDSNTRICIEYLNTACPETTDLSILEFPEGEKSKNLKTCEMLWYELSGLRADRNTIVLNLGGGVVTDLGGFVASTYMRGIRFVQIPTSMLGMADAAMGGKTGVDFGVLKNMIGTFARPEAVIIDSNFLKTLPARHYRNGLAEVLKHAYISDTSILDMMYANEDELISRSVNAKMELVKADEFEAGERKKLNFGHTIGHAIESHFLESDNAILHGEAIAAGMIMEAFLSAEISGLRAADLELICTMTDSIFKRHVLTQTDWTEIKKLLIHDKKNADGNVKFVLLSKLGEAIIDQSASAQQLDSAFDFYSRKA